VPDRVFGRAQFHIVFHSWLLLWLQLLLLRSDWQSRRLQVPTLLHKRGHNLILFDVALNDGMRGARWRCI